MKLKRSDFEEHAYLPVEQAWVSGFSIFKGMKALGYIKDYEVLDDLEEIHRFDTLTEVNTFLENCSA